MDKRGRRILLLFGKRENQISRANKPFKDTSTVINSRVFQCSAASDANVGFCQDFPPPSRTWPSARSEKEREVYYCERKIIHRNALLKDWN